MEYKIEGFNVAQLETLGKEVGTVDTRQLSISGNAQYVAKVYTALGLFGDVVKELKKFAPTNVVPPIDDETRVRGRLLGLSDADMDQMRAESVGATTYQVIHPRPKLPFGVVFPVGDTRERRNALLHFRLMLAEFSRTVSPKGRNPGMTESGDMIIEYYIVLQDFLSESELEFVFDHPNLIHVIQLAAL